MEDNGYCLPLGDSLSNSCSKQNTLILLQRTGWEQSKKNTKVTLKLGIMVAFFIKVCKESYAYYHLSTEIYFSTKILSCKCIHSFILSLFIQLHLLMAEKELKCTKNSEAYRFESDLESTRLLRRNIHGGRHDRECLVIPTIPLNGHLPIGVVCNIDNL